MLGLEPARRLIRRERDGFLLVDVVNRQVGARLRERIFQVAPEARAVLLKDLDPEFRFLRVGDAFLRFARGEERLCGLVASLEIAVIGPADHGVGVEFDFAPLLVGDHLAVDVGDLNPVDPEGELRAYAVAPEGFAEDLQGAFVRVEGASFAQEETAAAFARDFQRDVQELRPLHRARHRMRAGDRALQRSELDEMP